MKAAYIMLFLMISGCVQDPKINDLEVNTTNSNTDSIIAQSERNLVIANQTSENSDSTISRKVTNAVNQITTLKKEVKQLKKENDVLKTALKQQTQKTTVPVDVDTPVDDNGKSYRLRAISDN